MPSQLTPFLLHPSGDLYKFVELGSQSSLQQVLSASTVGNRITWPEMASPPQLAAKDKASASFENADAFD
ncbi:MAG: hypothetical protein CFE39_05505 [Comamonadaceae bacterium PBBC2]|nr:MAG: hypothetical protein CFE39_05505 [Comamonadaceae bacterium PBBC2]